VSGSIGAVLLVAITVIMAAAIAALLFGVPTPTDSSMPAAVHAERAGGAIQ